MKEITPSIYYGKGSKAIFNLHKKDNIVKKQDTNNSDYIYWGENNDYPQKFLKSLSKNGAAGGGLRMLKHTHYGQGIRLYKNKIENGKEKKDLQCLSKYKEIKKFFQKVKINRFFFEIISDLETFYISFPEFILSKDFKKIVSVRRIRASWCRFETSKNGNIENIFICADWENTIDIKSKYVRKVKMFDSYCTPTEILETCQKHKIHKFIIPVSYPMNDEFYYPNVDWHAVYQNGWMDVASSIPQLKESLFKNQMDIKYMVYISEEYFKRKYQEDWSSFDPEKKDTIRKELIESINTHLSGKENTGKSVMSPVFKDELGNWVKGIEIEVIKNQLKDGAYLPEASAANSEILFAQAVDPTLLGAGVPGGKNTGGSGSDKREAFSILNALFKAKREFSTDIFNIIKDYNGWDDNLEVDFTNTELTTLDKNPTGTQISLATPKID